MLNAPTNYPPGLPRLCFLSYRQIREFAVPVVAEYAGRAIVEVVDASLVKRVGASVAQTAYVDHTPAKPPPIPEMAGRVAVRDRGAGRPTKKERRALDRFRGR